MDKRHKQPPEVSIDTLRSYRAKGIPLMPQQVERLKVAARQMSFSDGAKIENRNPLPEGG